MVNAQPSTPDPKTDHWNLDVGIWELTAEFGAVSVVTRAPAARLRTGECSSDPIWNLSHDI